LRSEPEREDPGSEPEDSDPDWGLINEEPENGWFTVIWPPGLQALRVVVGAVVVVIVTLKAAGTTALAMMNDRTAGTA